MEIEKCLFLNFDIIIVVINFNSSVIESYKIGEQNIITRLNLRKVQVNIEYERRLKSLEK